MKTRTEVSMNLIQQLEASKAMVPEHRKIIQDIERLLSDIIETANQQGEFTIKRCDFLYFIVGEKRDNIRNMLNPEPF